MIYGGYKMKKLLGLIFLVVVIWLIFLTYTEFKPSKESWKCSSVECNKFVSGEEWAKQNCFLVNNQEMCKVNVENKDQLIPLQSINLSAFKQCIEFKCVEEIKVRNTSYDIKL